MICLPAFFHCRLQRLPCQPIPSPEPIQSDPLGIGQPDPHYFSIHANRWPWLTRALLWLGLALSLVSVFQIHADADEPPTHYVAPDGLCGGASPCFSNLQAAVDAVPAGGEIRVAEALYTGVSARPRSDIADSGVVTQLVYIDHTVTIRGGYPPGDWTTGDPVAHPSILDAQGNGRGLYILSGVAVTLTGLTVTGGNATDLGGVLTPNRMDAGGGLYAFQATVTITNCVFAHNLASTTELASGGGIFLFDSDGSSLSHSTFLGNVSSNGSRHGWGGGVSLLASDGVLTANRVLSNTGALRSGGWGGGIYVESGSVTLDQNLIQNNRASTSLNAVHPI